VHKLIHIVSHFADWTTCGQSQSYARLYRPTVCGYETWSVVVSYCLHSLYFLG